MKSYVNRNMACEKLQIHKIVMSILVIRIMYKCALNPFELEGPQHIAGSFNASTGLLVI